MRTAVVTLLLLCAASLQAADALTFEVYQDAGKTFRWRLKDGEGKVLATPGQGYSSKKYCEESVDKFKTNVTSDKAKFEVYKDEGGKSRWRLVASNGQTTASSPSGYKSPEECNKMIDLIKKEAKNAKVDVK